jgi:CelD/BcsL family acetyltransferase involved in cellulose biosynthesis
MGEYERRCNRDLSLNLRQSRSVEELRTDLGHLQSLHGARWGSKSRAFADRAYIAFHQDFASRLLERGLLRLFVLEDAGKAVAVLYCFRHGRTVYYYQSGRDPAYGSYRLGLLLIHWAIRECIAEGAEVFDLLTGTEMYKQRWATDCARNLRIRYTRRGIIGRSIAASRSIWESVGAG